MRTTRRGVSPTMVNLTLDLTIFIVFLVAMAPHWSGLTVHEWLSIAWAAAIVTHLLLHWQWIVAVARRFLGALNWSSRVNYVLNTLLFIDATVIIFTGLMISEAALPALGIPVAGGGAWHQLHELSANVALVLLGLHVALHWSWIVRAVRRAIRGPFAPRRAAPAVARGTARAEKEG